MKKEDIYITGDLVTVKSVAENDIEDYLHIRRYATVFKVAYDMDNGLWESMRQKLIGDMEGDNIICLIYQKNSESTVGYIELEVDDVHHPDIGIGILEEERDMLLKLHIF